MANSGLHQSLPSPSFRCDPEQYARLAACAKAQNLEPWNKWRSANPNIEIWLEDMPRLGSHVAGAGFKWFLKDANLHGAHLAGTYFYAAWLEDANLSYAHLEGADLRVAHLKGAKLHGVHMEKADARKADFESAEFNSDFQFVSHLEEAVLFGANLSRANLYKTHLEGADLSNADLRGTLMKCAAVDGATMLWGCKIDKNTDCTGVSLASARVEQGLRELLEYNARKKRWLEWYTEGGWLPRTCKRIVVQPFWWISDYGYSTWRILLVFLVAALFFSALYYFSGLCWPPGVAANLFEDNNSRVPRAVVPVRAIYLSIVSMAGFGDLRPNVNCWFSHVLMTLHLLVGYVLLAALVTRLAILFTGGGPGGRFAKTQPPKRQSGSPSAASQ